MNIGYWVLNIIRFKDDKAGIECYNKIRLNFKQICI